GTDCIPADSLSHTGGGLRFAPDGKLLLATGDAAWNTVNWDELKLRSQDLDSLAGKLLRINPDGSAPTDNPLYTGDPSANRSKVWSYGLRQPLRIGISPMTGLPFIGDVGSRYWEEINVGEAGSNFGWPCYEGYTQHPDNAALPFCQALFASETVTTEPLYSYSRSPGAAVIGGSFSQTTSYPEEFQNAYFFGDWVRNTIYTLKTDGNGALLPESGHEFLTNASAPVAFATGPDGEIYYLAWPRVTSFGELRHIAFTDTDQSPVAQASASPMGGLAPLTVQFSSDGSYDPEGGALTFFWDFDDGTNSIAEHPVHTFDTNGEYNVGLTVTDEAGNSDSVTLTLIINEPPKATISTPDPRTVYQAWDVIAFSGYGVDPEDGDIAAGAVQWTILLHHCEPVSGNCHTHSYIEMAGLGGTLLAPDQGDEIYYLEFRFTVVDSSGLSDTDVIFLGPDSDDDGLLDFEEVLTFGTNYLNPDSDGDGISDGAEDPDADGCTNVQELGLDETLGGLRDPHNPWDFYDVAGLSGATPDGVIDLLFDILGVIQHYSPDGNPPYDVHYDRGPTAGPNAWNMTAPDGVIDLLNDILGVLQQYRHDCM
ncbi:MAG: PQQ-dependent sugar dehydrogenase, partial [Chloroflexi bacterium]|nr:PQQ-dependent sugar dehydrogenase [Chloroflexota bacterium]